VNGGERLEALDLAIKALRGHEGRLSSYVERLKAVADKLEQLKANVRHPVVLQCESWADFVENCRGASLVTFEWVEGKGLSISAMSNGKICKYTFAAKNFKAYLSQQLSVQEEKVVEGEIIVPRKIVSGGIE